ncbi:hypothetical protein ACQ0QQ_12570 [Lysinibacillus sphaericus]
MFMDASSLSCSISYEDYIKIRGPGSKMNGLLELKVENSSLGPVLYVSSGHLAVQSGYIIKNKTLSKMIKIHELVIKTHHCGVTGLKPAEISTKIV